MSENRKIVFINQSTGYLTIDVINVFAAHYYQVDLMRGTMTEETHPLNSKVRITSIMKKTRKSNFGRFIRWGIATVQIQLLLWTKFRKHEIFYYSLPPFAYLGALLLRRKYSIMIFDVYPDVLRGIGIKESNSVYKLWARANRKIFKKAHRVYTIGDGLASLLKQYSNNIKVIPLWSTLLNLKPLHKSENPFSIEHGFQEKFVVQYSGNIGEGQNIEILIEVARRLSEHDKIHFLIIGRGTKVPKLKQLVSSYKLNNITILPFQPPETIKYSLANADLGIVMVEGVAGSSSLPSKTFNMMAVGTPILAIAPESSELAMLIKNHNNGVVFSNNDIVHIAKYVKEISLNTNGLDQMSKSSIEAAKQYTFKNAEDVFNHYMQ